jgi:hypothetical protein
MLPTTCDRGRVNGYAKNRHGIANGVNDGGWAKLSDAVSEKGSENESAVNASASTVDANDEERI